MSEAPGLHCTVPGVLYQERAKPIRMAFVGQASCVSMPAAHIAGLRFESCQVSYQTPMTASPNPQSSLVRSATAFHTENCRNKVTTSPDGFAGYAPAWRTAQDDVDDGVPFAKAKAPSIQLRATTNEIGQYWNAGMGTARCLRFALSLPTLRLTELYLQSNNIGDDGVAAVAATRTQIRVLNISSNNIGPNGAAALASALPSSRITVLEARHNIFGDEGSAALGRALPASGLECLILSFNKIGAAGAAELAATLGRSLLRELNLSSNEIGDEGGEKIGGAVAGATQTADSDARMHRRTRSMYRYRLLCVFCTKMRSGPRSGLGTSEYVLRRVEPDVPRPALRQIARRDRRRTHGGGAHQGAPTLVRHAGHWVATSARGTAACCAHGEACGRPRRTGYRQRMEYAKGGLSIGKLHHKSRLRAHTRRRRRETPTVPPHSQRAASRAKTQALEPFLLQAKLDGNGLHPAHLERIRQLVAANRAAHC